MIRLIAWICLLLAATCLPGRAGAVTPIKIRFPLEAALGIRDTIEIEFQTEPGLIYQVQVSNDMVHWADIGYAILGSGGPKYYTTTIGDQPRLFFRVRNDGDPDRVLSGGLQGPAGPQGPQGEPGEPITDYATAEQGAKADTALQPGHTPDSIEAEAFWATLNGVSLRDRFDRADRYDEGELIPNLAALPEIGPEWRVAIGSGLGPAFTPYIDKGGFRAADGSHCYLGNTVSSPGRQFSLFFEFSVEPTADPGAAQRLGMNVSFDSNEMITHAGGIQPGGVVHINWNDYGIHAVNYFDNTQAYFADPDTDAIEVKGHQFRTGDGLILNPGSPPAPLAAGTTYFAREVSDTEIQVAATAEDAAAGNTIDLTSDTGPVQTLRYVHEAFHAANRAYTDHTYHWHPDKIPLTPNKRYVMFIKAGGELLEVGIAGFGSVLFENSQLPSHVGEETTHFWWEPGGATIESGLDFKLIGKLHSVWSLPDLDTAWLSTFGGEPLPSIGSAGPYSFFGPIRSITGDGLQMEKPLPDLDFRFIGGAPSTVSRGTQTLAAGGHAFIEGGYLGNVGGTSPSTAILGRAPMAVDTGLVDPVSLPAGVNGFPMKYFRCTPALEPGDSEEFKMFGTLGGNGSKRIRLITVPGARVVFDSETDDSPIAGLSGPYSIELYRHAGSGGTHRCFTRFHAPGVSLLQRLEASGLGDEEPAFLMEVSGSEAGAVTLDAARQVVYRIKNN